MVDFGELKDKAEGFVAEHSDQVKGGVEKVGDFIEGKIGHGDKIDAAQEKVSGFLDNIASSHQTREEEKVSEPTPAPTPPPAV